VTVLQKVEILSEERGLADRDVEDHNARSHLNPLLKETIESCYKNSESSAMRRCVRHLSPFLNDVFPAA